MSQSEVKNGKMRTGLWLWEGGQVVFEKEKDMPDSDLYVLLAALNEIVPHDEWPFYQLSWGNCPLCMGVNFRHQVGCILQDTITESAKDLKELLK